MKMRKIMAAGIAATMAVTSLAAVASAETLTFSLKQTEGKFEFGAEGGTSYGIGQAEVTGTSDSADARVILLARELIRDEKYDMAANLSKPKVTITGLKKLNDNQIIEATATYEFSEEYIAKKDAANLATANVVDDKSKLAAEDQKDALKVFTLNVAAKKADIGKLVATEWSEIRSIKVTTTTNYTVTDEKYFFSSPANDLYKGAYFWNGAFEAACNQTTAKASVANEIVANVGKIKWFGINAKPTTDKYALLNMTTAKENETIYRNDVKLLSDTSHYNSTTDVIGSDGENQTYDDNGLGTLPYRFAGLASQVADFFNHKTNGSITMKFTLGAANNSGWVNGGVPSTEVGLRADLEANNFALFVNYSSSTGSLQAVTSVDKNAGTVTFDISEILADLGGQTKGVVTDLYYGLNQGIYYGDPYKAKGLLVEEITLSYEDDAAEEDIVEEEVVEEEEEEATEEEEVAEEEEEEVELEEEEATEEEEEEEEVDGEMFEEEETEEEDVNPGTGVALAVVPAMIAAAAAVVSKKRK